MLLAGGVRLGDHVLGPATASVLVVLYADFECPLSKRAHRVVKELVSWYGNLLTVVFRHFPIVDLHANAWDAARASEAAASQGLFWEMQNCLFDNQHLLDRHHLLRYAASLGLDVVQFAADLDADAPADRINRDIADAMAIGLRSTPGFFLNGRQLDVWDHEALFEAVDDQLRGEVGHLMATGGRRNSPGRRRQDASPILPPWVTLRF